MFALVPNDFQILVMIVLPLYMFVCMCAFFKSLQFNDINKDVNVIARGNGEAVLTVSVTRFLFNILSFVSSFHYESWMRP